MGYASAIRRIQREGVLCVVWRADWLHFDNGELHSGVGEMVEESWGSKVDLIHGEG